MYTNSKKRVLNYQLDSSPTLSSTTTNNNICSPLSDISNHHNNHNSSIQSGGSPFKKKLKKKNDTSVTLSPSPFNLSMELGNLLKNSNFLKSHRNIDSNNSNSNNANNINSDSVNENMNIHDDIDNQKTQDDENFMYNCGDDQELGEITYARPDIHSNSQSSLNNDESLNDSMVPDNISNSSDSIGCNDINNNNSTLISSSSGNEEYEDEEMGDQGEGEEEGDQLNDSSENDTPDLNINYYSDEEEQEQEDDFYIDYNTTIVIHPESPIFPWVSIIHDDCIELTSRLVFSESSYVITKYGNDILIEYVVQYPKMFYDIVSLSSPPDLIEKFKMVIRHPGSNYDDDLDIKFENSNLSIIIKKSIF